MSAKSIKATGNIAKDSSNIIKYLNEHIETTGKNRKEVFKDMATELYYKYLLKDENYQSKFEDFQLSAPKKIISNLINYLNSVIKTMEGEEKKLKKSEEKEKKEAETEVIWEKIKEELSISSETELETLENYKLSILNKQIYSKLDDFQRKEIAKKVSTFISEKKNQLNKEEAEQKRFDKAWIKLNSMIEAEQQVNKIPALQAWTLYKDRAVNKEYSGLSDTRKEELLKLIDGKIAEEEDKIYFEQVKHFTNGFAFLESEIAPQVLGVRRKFSDKKSFERFYELRRKIQNSCKGQSNEQMGIKKLLQEEQEDVSEVDKRILKERLNNINLGEKEIERL